MNNIDYFEINIPIYSSICIINMFNKLRVGILSTDWKSNVTCVLLLYHFRIFLGLYKTLKKILKYDEKRLPILVVNEFRRIVSGKLSSALHGRIVFRMQ